MVSHTALYFFQNSKQVISNQTLSINSIAAGWIKINLTESLKNGPDQATVVSSTAAARSRLLRWQKKVSQQLDKDHFYQRNFLPLKNHERYIYKESPLAILPIY